MGTSPVTFNVPLDALHVAVLEGDVPLTLADLSVARVDLGTVIVSELPGPFRTIDVDVVGVPTAPLIGTVATDTSSGLRFDIPLLAGDTTDRPLRLEGQVLAPDGSDLLVFSELVDDDLVTIAFSSQDLAATGPGMYTLTRLRLVDAELGITIHQVGPVNATVDVDTEPPGGSCVPLLAGQHDAVGTVCVDHDGSELAVTYQLDDGLTLHETHLAVGQDLDQYADEKWTNPNGSPRPGRFPYAHSHDGGLGTFSYLIAADDLPATDIDGQRTFAAHATVRASTGAARSAWAEGSRFVADGTWATHFQYPAG